MNNTAAVEKLIDIAAVLEGRRRTTGVRNVVDEILAAIGDDLFTYFPPNPMEWHHGSTKFNTVHKAETPFGEARILSWPNDSRSVLSFAGVTTEFNGYEHYQRAQAAVETHRNEKILKEFAK